MKGSVTPARKAALEILRAVRTGDLADRALERVAGHLPSREHGWLQELVYGTFRLRGRIDHVLQQRVRGGIAALQPDVLDVLRLGAYQLLEMGSVPPYAAVSQSVELCRAAGAARAAGLVNGVLNALQRDRDRLLFPSAGGAPVDHMVSWGSHPRWLVERWLRRWSEEEVRALIEANNSRPDLYIRPIRMSAAEANNRLTEAGIAAEPVAFSPRSLRIPSPTTAVEVLKVVPAIVQDPAAALVVDFAAPPPGARIIDLCSAPGGKAIGLADGGVLVAAADLSLRRLGRVRENADRLRLGSLSPVQADGRLPPFRPADLVLLDAPCTGTGTIRRHPDARWVVNQARLESLVSLQRQLLTAAATLVLPGGYLVYSTCSLEPEENEDQVTDFLAANPDFRNDPVPEAVQAPLRTSDGFLYVLPQRNGVDGAFAARLRRMD
ncbi:16S rRNA (cytosine(967)-C(5))-methyltransferase RsmB [soil metagenome]